MRKLMTLLLAIFCVGGATAEDVTAEQALELAQNFLNEQQTVSGKPRKAQGMQKQLTLQGKVSGLYVFDVKDQGGFVIVSGDDRTLPILGFSDTGNIDINNIPDNMRAWLQGYADEIAWLQRQDSKVSVLRKARSKVGSHSTDAIAPMLTCTWNQDAPFNNLCPTYYSSSKSATGCVATAMAQVMYYHKWPESSKKVIPGYTTYSYSISLSSLPIVTFDWDNMKDSYNGSYTTAQGNAVATLMKYCGYSVKMDYGPSSGAYSEDVATALIDYFDYNASTTKYVSRSSYSYANWTDLIYYELKQGRPVLYGGMSDGGGHEFVCDGYKYQSSTDFFHINWGWGGMSDNYFVLSALDPDQQGIGGSSSTDGFHYGQDAIIGIQKPTDSGTLPDISPNVFSLTVNSITLSDNPVEPNTAVNVTFNVTNNGPDAYDGDIWLCQREGSNNYLIELTSVVIPAGETQNCTVSYTPTGTGSYTFLMAYINSEGQYVTYEGQSATLEVTTGLSNAVVPVYGYWADDYSRSQFIIGEADLDYLQNASINGMTFYAFTSSADWGDARFDVYLSEVSQSTISALKSWDTLEKVYSGSLSISGGQMKITFDTPFYYEGGNLLVGINQTVSGDYDNCKWSGKTVSGASVGGYGSSISQQNFLPKTTFDFTPGTHLAKPKNLTISYTGGTSATVSWTSDAPAFDIDVNDSVTEGIGNPCTLTGLELATTYIIKVRARDGETISDWTDPVSFTTSLSESTCQIRLELTDAMGDGWNGAAFQVVDALTGTELGTFTNTDEAKKNEAQVYYVEVPDDRDIQFQWVKGSYDHECSYAAYDVAGNLIFSGSKRPSADFTYHVDCNATLITIVTLANGDDNTGQIESLDGTTGCEVTLQGRTLYKDGSWNTLCLPFDITIADSPLAGADVRTLSSATLTGETVTLNFTDEGTVTSLTAGTPCIIRWASAANLEEPVFTGVTIDKSTHDVVCDLGEGNSITFKGTYSHTAFAAADRSILFVGADNKLNYPLPGATIGALRAYFQLDGITVSEASAVKQFVLSFDEDPTGIKDLKDFKDLKDDWYSVSGRKLAGKPMQKGIYIKGGQTVIIK
ncbi:MAG: C10 family peptidase [Bacteroidaceae bacterium]|nr:C10 family peptidase [Bacteroidaceae bacterium]